MKARRYREKLVGVCVCGVFNIKLMSELQRKRQKCGMTRIAAYTFKTLKHEKIFQKINLPPSDGHTYVRLLAYNRKKQGGKENKRKPDAGGRQNESKNNNTSHSSRNLNLRYLRCSACGGVVLYEKRE